MRKRAEFGFEGAMLDVQNFRLSLTRGIPAAAEVMHNTWLEFESMKTLLSYH